LWPVEQKPAYMRRRLIYEKRIQLQIASCESERPNIARRLSHRLGR
jgi:hypothetical protein